MPYGILLITMDEAVSEFHIDQKQPEKMRILLADDHPLMCVALRKILEEHADFEVIAEVKDGEEAVRVATDMVPDVVIMDISMPKLNGLEATRKIKTKYPDILILVLTVHSDMEHIFGIFEAGADGYLTKSALGEEVVQSIRGLVAGETVLSPQVFKQLLKHGLRHPMKPLPLNTTGKLTIREQEVLLLAARGMSNKDIALRLNLSHRTVKSYLVDIFSKLGVGTRTEAVITGLRAGFFTLDDLEYSELL